MTPITSDKASLMIYIRIIHQTIRDHFRAFQEAIKSGAEAYRGYIGYCRFCQEQAEAHYAAEEERKTP